MEILNNITIDPEICHGKPTIRRMRYPVDMLLELMASGMTHREILDDYPDISNEYLLSCLLYAAKLTQINSIYKIAV